MTPSIHDFIHPEDQKARQQLEAIPGFQGLAKAIMKVYDERLQHGLNMASKIRLGPEQLPEMYGYLPPICQKLGIAEPELYLEMSPAPNAYTYGDTRIFVTVTSGLIEYLDENEIQAVIAHECGHILCRHTLYHTMARYLIQHGLSALGVAGIAFQPAVLALLYWYRRSEFSADRAAAVVTGGPEAMVETMIRLAGGPKSLTDKVNVDLFARQAEDYQDILDKSWWDKILQGLAVMQMDHPLPAVRVRELRRWCEQYPFKNLLGRLNEVESESGCPRCKKAVSADWKFCRYCGVLLNHPSSTQGAV